MRVFTILSLLLPVATGCSAITDYDYRFDGSTADAGMDSTVDSAMDSGADAADGAPDAGGDGGEDAGRDGGEDVGTDTGPDAGVDCPEPCFGDLSRDAVDDMQGTGSANWRYLADARAVNGLEYLEMAWGGQWQAGGALIASCGSACGDPSAFRLTSTIRDATVEFTVPSRGVYRIGGTYEPLEGDSQELLISRDGRNDALARIAGPAVGDQLAYDQAVSLEVGDRVRITLRSPGGLSSIAAGLSVWVSGPSSGDTCEIAVDFDDTPATVGDELTWDAQRGAVVPTGTDRMTAPPSVEASSIGFGNAVLIESANGSYVDLRGSAGIDMSGDFTVQLWGRYDAFGAERDLRSLFSNTSDTSNGVFVDHSDNVAFGRILGTTELVRDTLFDPTVGTWHFFRLVRSGSRLQLCVDGTARGNPLDVGTEDLTASGSLTLGYQRFDGPFFNGAVDEFRVYGEALPCEVPLP